jgi:heme-degrading monooxygenase HmoA
MLAQTPEPPYYAVIFTNQRTAGDDGYADTAERMVALASQQPGFLGVESVRGADGVGITVSYWSSEDAIAAWRAHAEHSLAREQGRKRWYGQFHVRVAKVERAYGMAPRGDHNRAIF